MAEEDDIAKQAFGVTAAIGGGIAAVGGVASAAAGVAVAGAAAVGVGIGMGIEYVTDGAISDTLSDGLLDLVGEEESLAAANAFDDGNYIEGAGHMLSGAGEHDRRRRLGRVRLRERGRGGRRTTPSRTPRRTRTTTPRTWPATRTTPRRTSSATSGTS